MAGFGLVLASDAAFGAVFGVFVFALLVLAVLAIRWGIRRDRSGREAWKQRHLEAARAQMPDPRVALHPDTAAALGLNENDWAWVVTPQGRIRLRAHLTATLHPRMADVQHGWWFPERPAAEPDLFGVFESNANVLCPDGTESCSPEIGSWPHTAVLCRVERERSPQPRPS